MLNEDKTYILDLDMAIEHTINIEKLKNCSLLITGATGLIGSFIADILLRYNCITNANINIYLGGRNVTQMRERFPGAQYLKYDLNHAVSFSEIFDYVIHAAGNAHPSAFLNDPVGTIMGNVESTKRLLDYLKYNNGKRFLYLSSGEVYGQGDLKLDEFEEGYSGYTDSLNPRYCYPISKKATECLCSSYTKQYGLDTVIVRPCHTYGPNITQSDSRASAQFFRNVINGENVVLKSTGKQLRSYNYVADCASAILTVLINGDVGEAYNIASPNSRVTIAELAEIIATEGNCKVKFKPYVKKELSEQSPILKQVLSSKKIEQLGWTSAFNIEIGVKHTINILRNTVTDF